MIHGAYLLKHQELIKTYVFVCSKSNMIVCMGCFTVYDQLSASVCKSEAENTLHLAQDHQWHYPHLHRGLSPNCTLRIPHSRNQR